MPDDGTGTQDSSMQQAGQIVQGAMAPAAPAMGGGGGGFFRSLLGTLLNGAMSGASVQPGPGAFGRGAQAAAANPNANPELKKQQDEAKATAKQMQQLQMAQTQLNMLHTYHMMAKEDADSQNEAYDYARDYYKQLDSQGKIEWVGGQTEDRATAVQQANELKKQAKDPESALSIQVVPMPSSTHASKQWGVARTLRGPLDDDVSVNVKGHEASGMPDQTFSASKGMDARDSNTNFSDWFKNVLVGKVTAKDAPPSPANPTEHTDPHELAQDFKARGIQVPSNIDNIWSWYSGQGGAKDLFGAKSAPGELSREQANAFIHKWIDPNFNPELADRSADYNKMLEKNETTFAMEGGKNARQAVEDANRVLTDSKAPQVLKKRAQDLYDKAQPVADKYDREQVAKGNEKEDGVLERERDVQLRGLQKVMDKDRDKVTDLENAMDQLRMGGGEGDAIASISALRGLVGGGGVRITGAELNAIASSVGWSGKLDVALNNLVDPKNYKKLSDQQRTQLNQILEKAYARIQEKDQAYSDASDRVSTAKNIPQMRAYVNDMNKRTAPQPLKIRVTIKIPDGTTTTGKINPSDYDPKTMTQVK